MKNKPNQVRIIGGKWRGRKLEFPTAETLRPTHDRIRETLFNWLGATIQEAMCLDLFAGSGALGFEALSRGARQVIFVDQDKAVIEALKKAQAKLAASEAVILCAQVPKVALDFCGKKFDIVFLDPPYQKNLLQQSCDWLAEQSLINAKGLVYLEYATAGPVPVLPKNWEKVKEKHTSTLCYSLVQVVV